MKRYLLCLVLCFGIITMVNLPMASSEEEIQVIGESATGVVTAVDLENSTVTLKVLTDEATQTYEEKVIKLDSATTINKGDMALGIADLVIGNGVSVEYTKSENGEMLATTVTVNE